MADNWTLANIKERAASGGKKNIGDVIVADIYANAEEIAAKVLVCRKEKAGTFDEKIDNILTSRLFGYPVMLCLLSAVFWLTIEGANHISQIIAGFLFTVQNHLTALCNMLGAPAWLHGILVLGAYRSSAWVVAVMLPPMAIFFPLFTLLEDLGYLPRVAFNLDSLFKKCHACGKQALTMCMGFGCNAAGVVSCRIIDSPRERLIAMLTNTFVPCNGRFPTFIALAAIFVAGEGAKFGGALVALTVTAVVLTGIAFTFCASWLLSRTVLKGVPSSFVLELPPYRLPQVGAVIYRSIIDRTVFVLKRAIIMAAPAGAVIWVLANFSIGGVNASSYLALWLQPVGHAIGLDGFILLAFLLGLPANEIVLPILLMSYLAAGEMTELQSLAQLGQILTANGWTLLTAVNMMLFCLLHWPCTTTLLSVYKESGSFKWTVVAFLLPALTAFSVCFFTTMVFR
ncbi:MAG: ferrous iron transporter B [Sporomusaceae bacterium]|jgi:ferrous iron transport protein B|nr:ferrous iron transporter B [Sporomusaceae bacterium]